jgi:hypothetical protein
MTVADIHDLLHRAAPIPRRPLDVAALVARRRRRRLRWLALGAVVGVGVPAGTVLVPAGDDGGRVQTVRPPETVHATVTTVAPAPAPLPSGCTRGGAHGQLVPGPVTVVDMARFALPDSTTALAVWDSKVAYGGRQGLTVCDLADGRSRVVAKPVLDDGEVIAVDGEGARAVFAESIGPSNPDVAPGDGGRTWRIALVDIATGRVRELHRGNEPDPAYLELPEPQLAGRWVVWTQTVRHEREVAVHDLETGRTRTIRQKDISGAGIAGDTVYFDAAHDGGRAVFAAPPNGSRRPEAVPGTSGATWLVAGSSLVAWSVTSRADDIGIWAMDPAAREPRRLAGSPDETPVVGDGFVAWADGTALVVATLEGNSARVEGGGRFVAASGDSVAWLELDNTATQAVRVFGVRRV